MRISTGMVIGALLCISLSASAAPQAQPAQTQTNSAQKNQAQAQPTPTTASVADAARKAREERKADPKKPHVFTNDDLPTQGSGINIVGSESATPAAAEAAPAGNQEALWRARFRTARAKRERDEQDLALLERELGKAQVQYYPNDPQKQLMQSVTNQDINDKRAKITQKQQDVKNDEAAISDLEDQLRKSGGDPGWAR
jgi:uncharacterized iron-regulated membrane protein